MSFDELMRRWTWRPIPNCPGRFKLDLPANMSVEALVGLGVAPKEYRFAAAQDEVLVVPLNDGGIISYRRPDGSMLHTLNTAEGFARKLA
jgi:hypothetical protein